MAEYSSIHLNISSILYYFILINENKSIHALLKYPWLEHETILCEYKILNYNIKYFIEYKSKKY